MGNLIKLGQGTFSGYDGLATKDQYQVYFTTDTHQIFVGSDEYTKSTKTLGADPTEATAGDIGRLYFVSATNSLWLCSAKSGSTYTWTRVANINDLPGTVTSVGAGEGLTTDQTAGAAITSSGSIAHAVPDGATTVTDPTSASGNIEFGGTFDIQGITTDKFGHVTSSTKKTLTMPTETTVSVDSATGAAVTLDAGDSFTVVTGVGMSTASGADSHQLMKTTQTFTLPSDINTTYSISSDTEGIVTLTGSDSSSSTALINGWNDLAKKSDITAVFKFKGTKATASELPAIAEVGDVYYVSADSSEYVCIVASETGTPAATFEKLGPIIDLSPYATTAYVDEKLTWQTF